MGAQLAPRVVDRLVQRSPGGAAPLGQHVQRHPAGHHRQHHLLPFSGLARVGYLPGDRILGLSKLARVVELVAGDLQTQERLTGQVAGWLQERLDPRGVGWPWRPSMCA
jgi:hypothetical protein